MKKTSKCCIILVMVLFIATIFSGCDRGVNIKIYFDSNEGSEVNPITVINSNSISIPNSPQKDGYRFEGWFLDNYTFLKPFTGDFFTENPIKNNITVYAKWVKETDENDNPKVEILMYDGRKIRLELFPDIAPVTVENFLSLVDEGYYSDTVFHRIIANFMIQAGMLEYNNIQLCYKSPKPSIIGEFSSNGHQNNIKHELGVISMARTSQPNSASAQFFLCSATSPHLDGDYAAFGKTIDDESNQVILDLSYYQTYTFQGMQNFPITPQNSFVTIISITRISESQKETE